MRYNEHSKCYVFIGQQPDGSVIEIELRDVDSSRRISLADERLVEM